jgi:mRNA interferase RelE/StbE
VATQYTIQINQAVIQQDLAELPEELQADFGRYQQVLAIDPHRTRGLPSHNLTGKLTNCRSLEIDCEGVAYRLVYRIYESPSPKRVLILSFAEHDDAYERAQDRKG